MTEVTGNRSRTSLVRNARTLLLACATVAIIHSPAFAAWYDEYGCPAECNLSDNLGGPCIATKCSGHDREIYWCRRGDPVVGPLVRPLAMRGAGCNEVDKWVSRYESGCDVITKETVHNPPPGLQCSWDFAWPNPPSEWLGALGNPRVDVYKNETQYFCSVFAYP